MKEITKTDHKLDESEKPVSQSWKSLFYFTILQRIR